MEPRHRRLAEFQEGKDLRGVLVALERPLPRAPKELPPDDLPRPLAKIALVGVDARLVGVAALRHDGQEPLAASNASASTKLQRSRPSGSSQRSGKIA